MSHPIQPRTNRRPAANASGLAGQNQERRLERIFGVLRMAEHSAADAIDQRPVAPHQRLECGLIAAIRKPAKQVGVGDAADDRGRDSADVA